MNILREMTHARAVRLVCYSLRMDVRGETTLANLGFEISYLEKNPHKRNEALEQFKVAGAYQQVLGLVEQGDLRGALEVAKARGVHQGRIEDLEILAG
jgi:hypothetical protein